MNAMNAGYGGGGHGRDDDRGRGGGGKKQRKAPTDKIEFPADKPKLVAALLAILAIANVGKAPQQGDIGKMRAWLDGVLHSNNYVRASFYSPGARAFAELVEMVEALGPDAYNWLVSYLNEHFDAAGD